MNGKFYSCLKADKSLRDSIVSAIVLIVKQRTLYIINVAKQKTLSIINVCMHVEQKSCLVINFPKFTVEL